MHKSHGLVQLTPDLQRRQGAALRSKRGRELGAITAFDWKLDAQDVEHLAHTAWIRMPATQIDQCWADRRRRRRVRARLPIDEERNDTVGEHGRRIRDFPRERDAVRALATPDVTLPRWTPRRAASAASCVSVVAEAAHATSRGASTESTLNHRGPFGLGCSGSGAMISR